MHNALDDSVGGRTHLSIEGVEVKFTTLSAIFENLWVFHNLSPEYYQTACASLKSERRIHSCLTHHIGSSFFSLSKAFSLLSV